MKNSSKMMFFDDFLAI